MKAAVINTSIGVVPIVIPNDVMDGNGFYVSYNSVDSQIYGSETTALVFGQMQRFYILNGDHRAEYSLLIDQGFNACLNYFVENLDVINKYSEALPT
ncbi:hypothetical protein [Chania multitudinisentens]|uniref:hypothetical protein n=1 Tax=Chania multitudinisentens TaxID=1639108 RepID=UPI0003E1406A|nr:hypothetical protein [Chania multitudinisentens]